MKKTDFQDIHYSRKKAGFLLTSLLSFAEFFYKNIINFKNFLYEKNILKEEKTKAYVICVGNLTTGGVGKTPIVLLLANDIAKNEPVAIISRGYKAKLNNKNVNIIKDFEGLRFKDGTLCGDEPYQLAKKASKNVIVLTSKNRKKAISKALLMGVKKVILDDGFSNRTVKKDKTIVVIDSKMRFGNGCLLPKGPLREPLSQIKRADELILVNKNDKNIIEAIDFIKKFTKNYNMKASICAMEVNKIYNLQTKAEVKTNNLKKKEPAVAFCAIGQPEQFFDLLAPYYDIKEKVSFDDHYPYKKQDIKALLKLCDKNNAKILITTQKDEAKISELINDVSKYTFNVLELKNSFFEINWS